MNQEPSMLIVDDNPENLRLLVDVFRSQGLKVRPVLDGAAALELVDRFPPDLILIDILMPEMDGYETCRRIKSRGTCRDVPVIFVSALKEPLDIVKALEVGGVDFVAKPFNTEELSARVHTHLSLREAKQTIEAKNKRLEHEIQEREIARKEAENARLEAESARLETQQERDRFQMLAVRDISRARTLEFENTALRAGLEKSDRFGDMVGKSAPMKTLYDHIIRSAMTDETVLISGETGQSLSQAVESFEKRLVLGAINACDGQKKLAAERLGVGVQEHLDRVLPRHFLKKLYGDLLKYQKETGCSQYDFSELSGEDVIELENVTKIFDGKKGKRLAGKRESKDVILQDFDYTVQNGDIIGLYGPNGSGKPTFCKLIAKTIFPDLGTIKVSGKVVPFLELGVAFHAELTANENIILNGALIGIDVKVLRKKCEQYT